ncbi:plasmid maintenance protein [Borreliella yangtzensis]|uniref:Transcriptional regulator n=2 Tax=Borreliella yangtzensis TaxID=683292 RepID=A0ABR6PBL0_9SPIR|nr:putative transcriptional regulator [Borreliella yangtzensis]MBB6043668.1 putative transcriptional regulator [Borreliella yangtzensis]
MFLIKRMVTEYILTSIFKKLHLEILDENSKKTDPNLKEISNLRLSSHIGRKKIEYQRLLKVSLVLEEKYYEYQKTKKKYQVRDILACVNSRLAKANYKKIAKRTIQKDLQKLIKMGLVANFSRSLGKKIGGYSLYKVNAEIWKHRIEIIRGYFVNEIREFVKDKRIVDIYSKEIDEYIFPNSIETKENQNLSEKIKDLIEDELKNHVPDKRIVAATVLRKIADELTFLKMN